MIKIPKLGCRGRPPPGDLLPLEVVLELHQRRDGRRDPSLGFGDDLAPPLLDDRGDLPERAAGPVERLQLPPDAVICRTLTAGLDPPDRVPNPRRDVARSFHAVSFSR